MEDPTQTPPGKTLKAVVGRHKFRLAVARDVSRLSHRNVNAKMGDINLAVALLKVIEKVDLLIDLRGRGHCGVEGCLGCSCVRRGSCNVCGD